MNYIFDLLLHISDIGNNFVIVLSIISSAISIIQYFNLRNPKNTGKTKRNADLNKKRFWIAVFIVSIIVFGASILRSNLVRVPDVKNKLYEDACHILSEHGLGYIPVLGKDEYVISQAPEAGTAVLRGTIVVMDTERINQVKVPDVIGYTYNNACNVLSSVGLKYNLIADEGTYVTKQDPLAGTVVDVGSTVDLETEPIGSNAEVRKKWEEKQNVEFGNLAVTFKTMDIRLWNDQGIKEWAGTQIKNYNVDKVYLLEEHSGVLYDDYIIENDEMIFKNVPMGIKFILYVKLDKWEEATVEVEISSDNSMDNTHSLNLGLIANDGNNGITTTFYVADEDKSSILKVNYMSNVKMSVQWVEENVWYGYYRTNEDGAFEYPIQVNKDREIVVKIIDPYGNGVDYECTVTLRLPIVGEPSNTDIVFLRKNGTCQVISEAEYFKW